MGISKASANAVTPATKGALAVGSGTNTASILSVGSNGDTLVADSSTTTGLRYNPPVGSLANPIINGGFDIWQRGTSIAQPSTGQVAYSADRWSNARAVSGQTNSRQTISDTTNLPNIQYALRIQRDSGSTQTTAIRIGQSLETVNSIPFAGKTITLSFYARKGANFSATSDILVCEFNSGTGTDQNIWVGYTGNNALIGQQATLTTTWQRFAYTATIPTTATELSVAFYFIPTGTAGTNDWAEITGVQIDLGTYTASTAPTFRRSGGTLAGELAACQRYFWRAGGGHNTVYGIGSGGSTTSIFPQVIVPVTMRTKSPILGYSNVRLSDFGAAVTPSALVIYTTTGGDGSVASGSNFQLNATVAGATAYRPYHLQNADNTAGYLQFDAEL